MRLTCAFLFLIFARLHAQTTAAYTVFSANEGLSQGMVFNMMQSKDDFIWIATKDGLNRYDGYRFEIFSPDPFAPFAIASSEIQYLVEDRRGWLWVTYDGGMDVFMPETSRFFHLRMGQEYKGAARSLLEMPDKSVWVVSAGTIWKLNGMEAALKKAAAAKQPFPNFTYTKIEPPAAWKSLVGKEFNSLVLAKDQSLLASSTHGLYRIDPVAGKSNAQPEILSGEACTLMGKDASGWLWLYSGEAIWVQKNKGAPPLKFNIRSDNKWFFDPERNLWNVFGNTLTKWDPAVLAAGGPQAQTLVLGSHSRTEAFYLTSLMIDRTGNAWVGTSGYGLFKVATAKPKFSSYMPLTSHQAFVEAPDGNLISLVFPRQIFKGRRFEQPLPNPWFENISPHEPIGATQFDKQGNGWAILMGNRLCRIDAQTKRVRLYEGAGIGILSNKNGRLLSLGEDALIEFDPATEKFTKHPFPVPLPFKNTNSYLNYNCLYEDSQGILWIYAYEGLLKATPTAGSYRFEHFVNNPADRSSLSNNLVLCAVEDPHEPSRYLWLGTKGGGLNRFDRQAGKFIHFKTEQGLPDNVVYGILPDRGGNLWMSTNKGLCRMSAESSQQKDGSPAYRFKNFTAADGLQSNEFNTHSFLKAKDGTMIFGGVNGVTVFHPDSLRLNERKPRMAITRIWVSNRRIWDLGSLPEIPNTQSKSLRLAHDENLVSLEFAALDFTNSAQNQYRYQLVRKRPFGKKEGENWVELGSKNTVQFANLQPGNYTLRVVGCNNDGIWSETPATLEFIIRPPWWASWWAYGLYVLALGGGILLLYRYQLRLRLGRQETLRLRELDEFKNRLFTSITHEFRTPLTVILGNLEMEKLEMEKLSKLDLDNLGKAGSAISQFFHFLISKNTLSKRNAESLLRLVNQILDLAKLESNTLKISYVHGDTLPYLRYIAESLHSLANTQNVLLRVESREAEIVMDYDPERLLQIVHNLLSNAIKFTPSGGRVTLRAGLLNLGGSPNLELTVSDTGAGVPTEDLPHIFDRFFQANNLEKARAGGTGIGLSLTKELVKAMGGEISVKSEVGRGTTFTVRLPIAQSPLVSKVEPQSPSPAKIFEKTNLELPGAGSPFSRTERLSHGSNPSTLPSALPTILLIEDNTDVVEYLASCLQENYQLDFAYNGRAGIEKALETVPDLIVSDVMMPEKDGFEVCQALKNDERTSHVPIILLTAKAGIENRIAGLRRGADAYLSKPFHREELLVTLANLLELRRKLQTKYRETAFQPAALTPYPSALIPDAEDAFVQKAKTAVLEHLSDAHFTVDELCRSLAMSQSQLHRKLTALTGKNATLFIRSIRLAKAKELLLTREKNVSEVAFEVGFEDPKYFSRVFAEEFGVAPSKI